MSAGRERENLRFGGGSLLAVDHTSKRLFIPALSVPKHHSAMFG